MLFVWTVFASERILAYSFILFFNKLLNTLCLSQFVTHSPVDNILIPKHKQYSLCLLLNMSETCSSLCLFQ